MAAESEVLSWGNYKGVKLELRRKTIALVVGPCEILLSESVEEQDKLQRADRNCRENVK